MGRGKCIQDLYGWVWRKGSTNGRGGVYPPAIPPPGEFREIYYYTNSRGTIPRQMRLISSQNAKRKKRNCCNFSTSNFSKLQKFAAEIATLKILFLTSTLRLPWKYFYPKMYIKTIQCFNLMFCCTSVQNSQLFLV
jgi:hypothetical protein